MKVLLLQTDIKWESPEYNRKRIEDILDNSDKTDLIILPEMFTTGFCTSPEGIAEKSNETLSWMQETAIKYEAAITGSVAIEENSKYYNRLYFIKPDRSYIIYDKRHLFSFAGEDKKYTAGEKRVIVEYKNFRILLQICYDLRFPVFARNLNDYDMAIYVANWPVQRIDAWNTLLRARAIENVCYIAGVNRVGNDPHVMYNGNSVLIDYMGKPLGTTRENCEGTISGEVDMDKLDAFRKRFPVMKDSDKFEILY